mgnify:FL=1
MGIKFIVSLVLMYLYVYLKTKKSFHMLQQNWYNDGNRYVKWIIKNKKQEFFNIDILILLLLVFKLSNIKLETVMITFVIFYVLEAIFYLNRSKKEQEKLKLKFTSRVKRLLFTTFILYLIPTIIMYFNFNETNLIYYYIILGIMVYLNNIIVILANIINKPIEKMVANYYKNKAIKKLNSMNNMKVIGITGSYGKTSSKNILSDILNIKYNATPTPKNFNTPLGLIITINNHLDKFSDMFIAEMGAFKRGEIKELCDLVHPTYGILTKIGTAHLDSFGSQANIQKGKFELIESLPQDGVGILNGDDELQVKYKLKNKCKILWIGIHNKDVDVRADNIKLTNKGTTFDCYFKGDSKKYKFETKLLGEANVYNILAGIALGYELGISIAQLQMGVKKVNPVEHRLELRKYSDINIIDDAYNSNPVGSKMALDVLKLMPGKKIVVTPGMIELANQEYELNKKFGEYIADSVDEVILVGAKQTKPIQDGLAKKKFPKEKIYILNDVKEAFALMQKLKEKDTYVLLENDLPDIFNEK